MQKFKAWCIGISLLFGGLAIVNGVDLLSRSFNQSAQATDDQKIVTIYDQANKRTILTASTTVEAVLKEAGVEIGEFDLVEPELSAEVSDGFFVNIFRARPLTIVDEQRQLNIMTPYRLASDITRGAGLEFYDEDSAEFVVDQLSAGSGIGAKMIIKRATVFELNFFGKSNQVRTQATTVGEFLRQKQIKLDANDRMNLANDAKIKTGMRLEIWREGEQDVTVEEEIAFTERKVMNYEKPVGYSELQQAGQKGKRLVTYKIHIKNGVEVSRSEISSVTLTEPKEQVTVVGAKIDLPAGSHEDWMAAAGIGEGDYGYVNYIIGRESGWSPTKWNYAGSGAYGLCQALPASKMSSAGGDYMTNPITQLRWCNGYAVNRYGSWANAYNFWTEKHWW